MHEYELRRWYRALFRDIYIQKRDVPSLDDRIIGAWLRSRRRAVIAGTAASALHGPQWVDANAALGSDEVTEVRGLPVTSVARTAFDLGRHLPRGPALARLDALMRATPFSLEDVSVFQKRYRGTRGVRRLSQVLPLIDGGAASPRESWLRLVLIDAGLPKPTTQIPVNDGRRLVGLLDMGWEDYRVAVEYDGDQHRSDRRQYVKDINRLAKFADLGWVVIRVVAEHRPVDVIARARQALVRRGSRAGVDLDG